MARKQKNVPSYRLHKPTGQGIVVINGRTHYLGKFETPESREKYDRLTGEWLAAGRATIVTEAATDPTVSVVLAAFMEHAKHSITPPRAKVVRTP